VSRIVSCVSEVGWLQPVMGGQWLWQKGINPLLHPLLGNICAKLQTPAKTPKNGPQEPFSSTKHT
jgi:hypothetical protein